MKNVLIYKLGSMGDLLVSLPAFHLVRSAFPQAHITLLTNTPVSGKAAPADALLGGAGLYDDTLLYPIGLRSWRALLNLRRQLAGRRFDCAVYLAAPKGGLLVSIREYLFLRLCGIPRVIGVPFSARTLDQRPSTSKGAVLSETDRLLECVQTLGRPDLREERWWDLKLTPSERAVADSLLAEHGIRALFLAASVGTKVQCKDWEEPNWLKLMQRLGASYPHLPLVLVGVEEERDRSSRMVTPWQGPVANLCGATSPRVSAALLGKAAVMVCHDSGPMHLAATVGTPCVAIFSARNLPGKWFPRGDQHTVLYHHVPCMGCELETCVANQKACILSITVDEVFSAVQQQLARRGIAPERSTSPIAAPAPALAR